MLSRILALLCLLALSPASPAWGQGLKASLVQKKMADAGPVSFETGLVQVAFPDGKVEVLPYRTHLTPVAAKGRVFIFPAREGRITGIVVYDANKRQARNFPLPSDLDPYFGAPRVSPDGARMAYYVITGKKTAGEARGQVRVRSFPKGRVLWESPPAKVRATDVPPAEPVWKGLKRAEFDPEFFDPPRPFVFQAAP